MKKAKSLHLLFLISFLVIGTSCNHSKNSLSKKEISILENEKWWGGAVVDGRNMPFNDAGLVYDQFGDCKGNQAAPLFLSNKGRYIWSEEPINITITKNKIVVDAKGSEVIIGQQGRTLKSAFRNASKSFFPSARSTPDPLLFTNPQYNTWIELQYDQNEKGILKYANDIINNGFPPGVIMIDDNWQERYGTWDFDRKKFSDPKNMIEQLHKMGFKVMLWVVPFISPDSPDYRKLAKKKLLIFNDKEKTTPAMIEWWNGVSALIDLSNPEGEKWFKDQLNYLTKEYMVDGFKLDAGDPEYYLGKYSFKDYTPNEHCEAYARLGLDYSLNELRACWKMAGQPLAQRLRDKRHSWEDLRMLIPDMIGLGLIGHQYGCPDMIGGGEIGSFQDKNVLDEELIVRSAQVSALMPMMQFSVAPWRILNKENLEICKNMADLHFKMGNTIHELAWECANSGEPMVRNLEYEYPEKGFENIKDQFLLSDKIMIAPVINKGERSREIIFPEGKWLGDDGEIVTGPVKLKVDVPLERLPWYQKLSKSSEAAVEDYQNRTPEQLLKLIAFHNIKPLEPGEYFRGDWESVLKSNDATAEWFGYPMGVTLMGLQRAYELLKDEKIIKYVSDYNAAAVNTYAYLTWQKETFGKTKNNGGAFDRIYRLGMMDDCGASGAEMLESVLRNRVEMTPEMLDWLSKVAKYICYDHARLPDGSLWRPISPGARPMSIWVDDLAMSCPFLIRWAEYKNEPKYIDDAARQIINYASYLQDADGVWYHAYLVDEKRPAKFKWGRANGWVMLATAEVLSVLPENHPKRHQVMAIFQKHIEGLKKYQTKNGLWHQVIDHSELYWGEETSCSAMFGYAIARAVNRGWIDKSNLEVVKKVVDGLNRKVEAEGTILGVCKSCSIGDNLEYYANRPTRVDDFHGPGPMLLLLTEYLKAERNR